MVLCAVSQPLYENLNTFSCAVYPPPISILNYILCPNSSFNIWHDTPKWNVILAQLVSLSVALPTMLVYYNFCKGKNKVEGSSCSCSLCARVNLSFSHKTEVLTFNCDLVISRIYFLIEEIDKWQRESNLMLSIICIARPVKLLGQNMINSANS